MTVRSIAGLAPQVAGARVLDVSDVSRMDTAGAWFLIAQGAELAGLSPDQRDFLDRVRDAIPTPDPEPARAPGWRLAVEQIGRATAGAMQILAQLVEYLGRFIVALLRALRHPRDFRLTSLVYHAQETGLKAVPIVALMGFLIGIVLAFQGATQLRQFGAEVFVVDLIAISMLRELGILLTAIIVAGRTASALTASIGAMKMREEIDAMRTLGLDPDRVLILPRVLALIITLPILGLVANLSGLVGGAIMSWVELGVSPSMFRARLVVDTNLNHAIVGLVKAPVFALLIGVIGCHAGMRVGKDTESLGRMTSSAVVAAIFAVIMADALFSIFFALVGI
ncbi:ABC transporter permease [Paracoccus sp. (in: a-proteobacteria)]|uniref:MlaE family ABC transporter permease n=1 Tax=Paracoccus sp. TaxID=267 RepID=UPI0026E1088F|nr:ABC transporter permease [Paracoccus sp. (in: a-proteobacteria)]MDO5646827.1 ABC transporter permease [Paracoccus sp. (in: a-proteobacteria)]